MSDVLFPIVTAIIVGGMSFLIGMTHGIELVHREAIENGHAHYDPKTREFKWGELP